MRALPWRTWPIAHPSQHDGQPYHHTAGSNTYFARRPRESRIGALASRQSRPLADRETLLREVDTLTCRLDGQPVPRPAHWRGFRLLPAAFEFWQERAHRLHDRVRFAKEAGGWVSTCLYP